MIAAGIDVGRQRIIVVPLRDSRIAAQKNHRTEPDADSGAREVLDLALEASGITVRDAGEVLSHRRRGAFIEDIPDGVHDSVTERVLKLIKTTGPEGDFVITGGVAHNSGVVHRLEKEAGLEALIPPRPQFTGALGAAWLAREVG